MEDLVVPALKLQQNGQTLYQTCLTGEMLLKSCTKIDMWTPSNTDGYQRKPSEKRMSKIASYLRQSDDIPTRGMLPQSVTLALRGEAAFTPDGNCNGVAFQTGTLTIPGKYLPLYEDDGQHRIGGLRKVAESDKRFLDYPLPAVIIENSSKLQEAVVFHVINTNSKPVPVDLAQRLIAQQSQNPALHDMLVQAGKDWVAKATEIVDALNDEDDQPWKDFIVIPNGLADTGVRQNTLVRSLRTLLTADGFIYKDQSSGTLAELLVRYWRALAKLFPEATNPTTRDEYNLMKSIGVLAMHSLAPSIFDAARQMDGKVTENAIIKVLQPAAKALRDDFWHSSTGEAGKVGTNNKGVRLVVERIRKHLATSAAFTASII